MKDYLSFKFLKNFDVDYFKSLLNFLQYCLLFLKNLCFWFFGREARGILAPQPRTEPTPSALEGEV